MIKMTKLERMTRNIYTTREHGIGHVSSFCVPPFVLTDDKCIFSCVIFPTGANSPLNQSNKELRMKQWGIYFHSSFPFFQDYAIKAETDLELHHSSSEDQNKKNV